MTLHIFFSWQTQTKNQGFDNKAFLIECINNVCKKIENKGKLKGVFFQLDEGLRNEAGTPSVADKMMEQIDLCDIFIGDMTITTPNTWWLNLGKKLKMIKGLRREPNANVYGEFHRALGKSEVFEEQIILVMNDVNGNPDDDTQLIPFDSRGRRFPIKFHLKNKKQEKNAKDELTKDLKDAILQSALAALKNIGMKYSPFIGWQEQVNNTKLSGKFIWTTKLRDHKEQLIRGKGIIRLLGLSGLGKTKLVLECFRDSDANVHYLYCDCQRTTIEMLENKLSFFFKEYKEAVLVLDNCNKETLNRVVDLKSITQNVNNTIITIFNEPEERQRQDVNYIVLDNSDAEVVVQLLEQRGAQFNDTQRKRIQEFSGGIPMMAVLLIDSLNRGKTLGNLGDQDLMTKLLGIKETDEKRTMIQTLALFRFIGWKDERRSELEYVAKNKSITSIANADEEVMMNEFDELIQKCLKRGIMEESGRTVGLRPIPLALYLIVEWIDKCSTERLLKVIDAIQTSKDSDNLIHAFHQQFKNMGFHEKAREMLNNLLGEKSPFGNVEVINTELGSHLFRTFVEVNPIAVSDLLYRVLASLSIDELRKIDVGRRNLVWAIEKLCFDSRTFHKGAFLMMRLALAENEEWANNATSDFCSLFPIVLPATSVCLSERLGFLKKYMHIEDYKKIVLSALARALSTSSFVSFSGAEKQGTTELKYYSPTDRNEIHSYLKGCADLLLTEIENNTKWKGKAISIFENSFGVLCNFGMASLILPYMQKTAELLKYDWDKMQENLSLFRNRLYPRMDANLQEVYNTLQQQLTKNDFVSRFARIEQETCHASLGVPFEEKMKKQELEFKKMAKEMVNSNIYSFELLRNLMLAETNLTIPFGKTLAENMGEGQAVQFVKDGITVLNEEPKAKSDFYVDFIATLKSHIFEAVFHDLCALNDKKLLFAILGKRSALPSDEYFEFLLKMVQEGTVATDAFTVYWLHLQFEVMTEANIVRIFKEIETCKNGVSCILKMAMMFSFGHELVNFLLLKGYLKSLMLRFRFVSATMMDNFNYINIAQKILSEGEEYEFAVEIHKEMLKYLSRTDINVDYDYQLRDLYEVLVAKYFRNIWHDLSKALLSDNTSLFYLRLKDLLGVSAINENPVLFKRDHTDEFLLWCEKNPAMAPQRLVDLMPVTTDNKVFTPLLLKILDKYGNQEDVLIALENNLGTFAVTGSAIPLFENQISMLSTLTEHANSKVREWANKQIAYLRNSIVNDKTVETEFWAKYK